ncbi:MAG: putative DNA modification/repair radical SAM protein [Megasphaera sp.]|jgi:putative DNA modification/repair radical SAM protein|nr:putative DNA modification/repair radical SAM protein [Megasphaera sp.]MCH4187187.1 putative DNA modification/repair radical SAM protein [Megasphaera sp.]MCH4217461.1 putative DNA modification/repair radical SAM protein [Megasphaera sp.]
MEWEKMQQKLTILSDAAKYDVSCSSSGSHRMNTAGGIGNAACSGICHTWSADGRCVSLLKILMTNRCIYDCAYCVNRCSRETERAILTPAEIAELTIEFYRRNYIEGLFLSSGVYRSPDYTTELLIETARQLRDIRHFNGYIHMKGIPGTDKHLIRELGRYVDRMSVNIELPSSAGLKLLAPQKTKQGILVPMGEVKSGIVEQREDRRHSKKTPAFVPAGQTTQLIVGATADSDKTILRLSEALYHKIDLKRVYYSAYVPVLTGEHLPALTKPPLLREHRLYQADWLLRFYQFSADEILSDAAPDFDLHLDPKACWALRHPEVFPVEVNRSSYHMLLRVPGIGVTSAKRICAARRHAFLSYDTLRRLGIVLKRAKYFITCKGKFYGESDRPEFIRQRLLAREQASRYEQVDLFEGIKP